MEEKTMKEMIERIKTLPYLQNMKVREVEKNAITFISEKITSQKIEKYEYKDEKKEVVLWIFGI